MFLHDTILEALMCGDTSIAAPVKDAKDKVAELAKADPKTGKTGFETQFEVTIYTLTVVTNHNCLPVVCYIVESDQIQSL